MPRKKKTSTKMDNVPNPSEVQDVSVEQNDEPVKYVVVRAGFRVSDTEYIDPNDPAAISERDFWRKVGAKSKDGSVTDIVQFNKRLHRTY